MGIVEELFGEYDSSLNNPPPCSLDSVGLQLCFEFPECAPLTHGGQVIPPVGRGISREKGGKRKLTFVEC
jgi:hypothetical protein